MPARWDGDYRGRGIGDASQLVPGVRELAAAFSDVAWVAEQPEIHLRPHVEAWCERDGRVELCDAYTDDSHAFILNLKWRGEPASIGEARATIFSLIGSFAPDASFAPHGHLVVINVAGVL